MYFTRYKKDDLSILKTIVIFVLRYLKQCKAV